VTILLKFKKISNVETIIEFFRKLSMKQKKLYSLKNDSQARKEDDNGMKLNINFTLNLLSNRKPSRSQCNVEFQDISTHSNIFERVD
jgi:hypothetical protein